MMKTLYLISTDELLLAEDKRQFIKTAAQKHGFLETAVLHVDSEFRWDVFLSDISSGQLFSEKRIIDLRNPAAKFDVEIFKKIIQLSLEDILIIITTQKITTQQKKSAWFQLVLEHGVHYPLWPIAFKEYPHWITKRAQQKQIHLDQEAILLLSYRTEGNLYAAEQAIEKCALLYPNETITREKINTILTDSAHYTVFDLSDALFEGRAARAYRILFTLKQLEIEPSLILWSLARELRNHRTYARFSMDKIKQALQHAAAADEIIKGAVMGDPWFCFSTLIHTVIG